MKIFEGPRSQSPVSRACLLEHQSMLFNFKIRVSIIITYRVNLGLLDHRAHMDPKARLAFRDMMASKVSSVQN